MWQPNPTANMARETAKTTGECRRRLTRQNAIENKQMGSREGGPNKTVKTARGSFDLGGPCCRGIAARVTWSRTTLPKISNGGAQASLAGLGLVGLRQASHLNLFLPSPSKTTIAEISLFDTSTLSDQRNPDNPDQPQSWLTPTTYVSPNDRQTRRSLPMSPHA